MKTALIDSSSAILLFKAGLFDDVAGVYRLVMTPAVLREVTVDGRSGASHFNLSCWGGLVGLTEKPVGGPWHDDLNRLGAGERETLRYFGCGGVDFVILDDGKGVAYCRSKSIPHINALLCPKILHLSGRLNLSDYSRTVTYLLNQGRYSSYVVEFEKKSNVESLFDFMPCTGMTGR